MSARPRRANRRFVLAFALPALLVAVGGVAALTILVRPWSGETEVVAAPEGAWLVFAEFGPTADFVYAAPATAPADRMLIDTVDHAEGWGFNPSPTMAGSLIAYTVLPPEAAGRRDARAELWVLDVATRNKTRLASDADLLVQPRFARGGAELVYRTTSEGAEQALVRVDLDTRARRVLHAEETAFGLFPVGFDGGGALLFVRLSEGGSDLFRVEDGGTPEHLFKASANLARDWHVSPDGRAVSYLAPVIESERVVHRAFVISLSTLEPLRLHGDTATATEQYGPVWTPDGGALTVGQEAFDAPAAPAVVLTLRGDMRALAAPERGFDVPLGWSPDGRHLAVTNFDGVNSYRPGSDSMIVISIDGERVRFPTGTELLYLGWLQRA